MKKSGSRVGGLLKNIFNFRAWIDFDRIYDFMLYLISSIKFLFIPQKNPVNSAKQLSDNFQSAMSALNLTEADLKAKQISLYRLSIFMSLVSVGFLLYAIYHLFYGGFAAVIISLVLMLIALVLAFRYHFWYFQIKEKKLGCTFREWYQQGFLGKKS